MSLVVLPTGVSLDDYAGWASSDAGKKYTASQVTPSVQKGLSVSHQPPADQIAAWKQQQQGQKAPDMSAYRAWQPGAAQPSISSQGTPYAPYSSAPQRPSQPPAQQPPTSTAQMPSNTAYADAWNQAYKAFTGRDGNASSLTLPGAAFRQQLDPVSGRQSAPQYMGQSYAGNMAYMPNESRPSYFEQRATDFSGAASQQPDYSRRDAFVDLLNRRLSSYQANSGVYQGNSAPPASWSPAPSYDINALWSQAGDAARRGFSNPFALR